jgi:hypothetical protein
MDTWATFILSKIQEIEREQGYLHLAQTDADEKHKIASPVMNWRL